MKKPINKTHYEGLIYESHLENKVTGDSSKNPGTPYIGGSIDIATNNDIDNIVKVSFMYVTPKTAKGGVNKNFAFFQDIIDGKYKTVIANGKEQASKIVIDSAFELNEWYNLDAQEPELISVKRSAGGFVVAIGDNVQLKENEEDRNVFDVDMVITNFVRIEANEETGDPEKGVLKGCIFDWKGNVLPTSFDVYKPAGIDFFENQEISNATPLFTKVTGTQISTVTKTITEEVNGFDATDVRIVENTKTKKAFVVTRTLTDPYEWDEEGSITAAELKEKMAQRQIDLATMLSETKARRESNTTPAKPAGAIGAPAGGFDF